jgi:hypothetical protein
MSVRYRLRRALAIAGIGAVTALAVGCAHSSTPQIATASEPSVPGASSAAGSNPAPSPTSTETDVQKYVASVRAFAKCMRGKGFDVPDPDASGNLPSGAVNPKTQPGFTPADTFCVKVLLPVPESLAYPPLTPAQLRTQQKISVCMRHHGLPNYPDPVIETDPNSPELSHNAAAVKRMVRTRTFQHAINACDLAVYGTTGVG